MEDRFEKTQKRLISVRRQLAELEKKRGDYEHETPPEDWKKEFLALCRQEDEAEAKLNLANQELVAEINQTREQIVNALEMYKNLNDKKSELEKSARVNIIHPIQQLRYAKRKNRYLEEEYQRMFTGIQNECYAGQHELEEDIRLVLMNAKNEEYEEADDGLDNDTRRRKSLLDSIKGICEQDQDEMISLENLDRDFRRIVLPRIHPDTSDTPAEVFNTVYEAYENGDALLMDAYIAEYRGKLEQEQGSDPVESMDKAVKTQRHYQNLNKHLQARLNELQQQLSEIEAENPEELENMIRTSRGEILDNLRIEEEQILAWREKIEGLVQVFWDWNEGGRI